MSIETPPRLAPRLTADPPPPPGGKAPLPAAVAALVAAFRDAFKKVEDRYMFERRGHEVTDTRHWTIQFRARPDELDGGFIADCPQLPGAMSQGETEQEALENLADAVDGILYLRFQRALKSSDVDFSGVRSVRVVSIPLP